MYREYTLYALLVLLSVLSTGCHLFTVPKEVAIPASYKPISHLFEDFRDFSEVQRRVKSGLEPVSGAKTEEYNRLYDNQVCVDKFLHLSDAHICDEHIYEASFWKKQREAADRIKEVAIRAEYVQEYDLLTFASFLAGAGGDPKVNPDISFIVHTGDLLDISLATELAQSLKIIREFNELYSDLPIYSMAGNHDGLIWGNLPDKYPYLGGILDKLGAGHTRGLGVNRTEFVLGHVLADPDPNQGFGFGLNEIMRRFSPTNKPDIKALRKCPPTSNTEQWDLICEQLDDIVDALANRADIYKIDDTNDFESRLYTAKNLRGAIHTTGEGDKDGLKCGYYSWFRPVDKKVDGLNGIRYIALDTRNSESSGGQMDNIQLGWLYNELAEALIGKECVIIFAHHAPGKIRSSPFRRMLKEFRNIAAYFYGHEHPTDKYDPEIYDGDRFLLVQTPSLIDFPQTGREVEIHMLRNITPKNYLCVRFRWRHVRPEADNAKDGGIGFARKLNDSRKGSREDYNRWSLLKKSRERVDSYQDWVNENLQCDGRLVEIRFTKNAPEPRKIFEDDLEQINLFRGHLGLPLVLYPSRTK